ncbi:valine--tRNA ligase [candidate division KSB1 bacterium]|nr:valine--tRNA ligase [candidate division KSB1 bacterium]
MPEEIAKVYNPEVVEDKWYKYWEEKGYFHARVNPDKKPYTVVIPPPNITGMLTMGHILNNTIQDILIRYKRMSGHEALWMPGTDHAGIATQNVVEKELAREGLTRHDLGREGLVQRIWEWREKYGGIILEQLRKLGASCDWERERFTMDEGLSRAVRMVFVKLYEKGLIYKGSYIINWCPRCQTALSDEEAEHREMKSHLWYIKYPLKDARGFIVVATTRPETMLGDTGVAVNPKDKRYQQLVGKKAILPLLNRKIPIIADGFVDPAFGTGAVKVTPAHDPNDFDVGNRHNLPFICVMNEDGTMNENAGPNYLGMDRFACREAVLKDLEKDKLVAKVEDYAHSVGHCYRCGTMVEPYLSEQWFVRMKPLAKKAIAAVRDGRVRFHPKRWEKTYFHWLENVRDWCISRQIWWGHRLPVYYCRECQEETGMRNLKFKMQNAKSKIQKSGIEKGIIIAKTKPEKCPYCGAGEIYQDENVLDTWFSSWLWPFSTLGWPEENEDLSYFFPTDTLVTAPDIIFFWVARMIMASLEFMGEAPFRDVYFTGMIRDIQGRKLSKSLGNSPDPLDVIASYGADALRFTMVSITPHGQDLLYANELVEMGRNFANKIWNASRLILMNLNDEDLPLYEPEELKSAPLELMDRWILSRLHHTIGSVTRALDNYRFNTAAKALYRFFWGDFCDWYLELVKGRWYNPREERDRRLALSVALSVLESGLKLLHPIMPFLTEEIWDKLREKDRPSDRCCPIIVFPFPKARKRWIDPGAEEEMGLIQGVVGAVRNIRGVMGVPPGKLARLVVRGGGENQWDVLKANESYLIQLAKLEGVKFDGKGIPQAASAVVEGLEVLVPMEGLIDINVERARLERELKRVQVLLSGVDQKLGNKEFLKKAPKGIIERERKKQQDYRRTCEKIRENLAMISNT